MGREHGPVPEQAPLHPPNVEPELAEAVSVTVAPAAKLAAHVLPQFIPEGLLVTIPLPLPIRSTFNTKSPEVPVPLKVAVTLLEPDIVKPQVPVPEQDPLQPLNVEPETGVADSVTCVPFEKLVEQTLPQLIPEGLLSTEPDPVPERLTPNE